MDIKTVNEKLEQFFEEAAMVASNHAIFEDFYNYCLKNPKLKQNYIYVESGGQLTGKPSASLGEKKRSLQYP